MTEETFVIRLTLPNGLQVDHTVVGVDGMNQLHYMQTAAARINDHVGFDALVVTKVQVS